MRLSDIFVSGRSEEFIRQIYPKADAGRMIIKHGKKKSWIFILMVTVSVLLSIPVFVSDRRQSDTPVKKLGRNEAGYGSRSVILDVTADDGYSDRITVKVNERVAHKVHGRFLSYQNPYPTLTGNNSPTLIYVLQYIL